MIKYVKGDATQPIGEGMKIIVHVCNNIGGWGSGFVLAISKRWTGPVTDYRQMEKRILGDVRFIGVDRDIIVANMIGQDGIKTQLPAESLVPPVRYVAIHVALKEVASFARNHDATIHMPRIGCDRAGGTWSIMEAVIKDAIGDIDVTVYDL